MILFDLLCSQGHGFESWFRDSDSFEKLVAVGEVRCAVCGDREVKKALMAPNISTSKGTNHRADEEQVERETTLPSDEGAILAPTTAVATSSMAVHDNPGPLSAPPRLPVPEKVAEAMRMLREVQTHIEKNFDHVGKRFAEEARKMHYGEAEKRSIYGEATRDEAEELVEEGIDIDQMPWLNTRDS